MTYGETCMCVYIFVIVATVEAKTLSLNCADVLMLFQSAEYCGYFARSHMATECFPCQQCCTKWSSPPASKCNGFLLVYSSFCHFVCQLVTAADGSSLWVIQRHSFRVVKAMDSSLENLDLF